MTPSGGRWSRRIQAAESAGRLLDELGVDVTTQIDVFGICEDLGLWLAFLPMDNLLGAFIPEGAGGVLVTTQRPIPIQRYTAAHEVGHWRLDHGHGLALDGEEHVLGATPIEREQLAQVFAASLLMPPPLVFGVLERLGATGSGLEPQHAYAVAREAGVSYEAAVRQLTHLEVITGDEAVTLRQYRPLQVKAELALGRRPVNGYADVWPVDEHWDDQLLALRVEDEVVISLPENRSTGYRWMFPGEHPPLEAHPEPPAITNARRGSPGPTAVDALRAQFATASESEPTRAPGVVLDHLRRIPAPPQPPLPAIAGADLVSDEYVPARAPWLPGRRARQERLAQAAAPTADDAAAATPPGPLVAGTGRRLLGVRFAHPGPATLRLEYRSPFNHDDGTAGEYVLHALVEARHVGFSVDQLADSNDEPWTAQARQRQLERPADPLDDPDGLAAASDEDTSI